MCGSNVCLNCGAVMAGRKRKYCDKWCDREYRRVLGGGAQRHTNCAICNEPLSKRGHAVRKYCSNECKSKAAHTKAVHLSRTAHPLGWSKRSCPGCNTSFFPNTVSQTYCTRVCSYDSTLRVNREVAAIRRLGKKKKLPWRLCDLCGRLFKLPIRNGSKGFSWQQKTCSKDCQDELAAKMRTPEAMKRLADLRGAQLRGVPKLRNYENSPIMVAAQYHRHIKLGYGLKPCLTCGNVFLPRGAQKYCGTDCRESYTARRRTISCRYCGVQFSNLAGFENSRVCSDECRDGLKKRNRRLRKHKDRARHYGVEYHQIRKKDIFERDGWRCSACGCDTPEELAGTNHDDEPNLDHIIPISQGGPHTEDNLQCLCRTCNVLKGTKTMTEFISSYIECEAI